MRLRIPTALACVATLACLSCDERCSADRAAQEGMLIVGNNQEPLSLDPHKATSVADGKIISALLEGLVRPDPREDGLVHPAVAERWEHNADASEWTFYLRDCRWSDGTAVSSHDFSYAFHRMLHPRFGAKYAEMLYILKNAEPYNKGEISWDQVGVHTPDAHTLKLTLKGPTPHFLQFLLHFTWSPVPAHSVEAHGGMLDRKSSWTKVGHWVGNGAYVLKSHVMNRELTVEANPFYWRRNEVRNKAVRFLPIVNGYTETRMYFDGKMHISNNVPPELIDWARRRGGEQFCSDRYYCTIFYRLNTQRKPLDDVRVRRALSLAVDRQALVSRVVRGAGTPATEFTPPVAGEAVAGEEQPDENAAEARRLLCEAGYPEGKGFPTLEIMTTSRDVQRVVAECIQAMWEQELGIHVEIRSCEWTAYKAAQQQGDYDISSSSWSGDYLDAATFVEMWKSGSGNNCTGWGSRACDEALARASQCARREERNAFLQEAERVVLKEQPIIPLYWSSRTYLKNSSVRGWYPLLLDNHPLDAVDVSMTRYD